MRRRDFIALLTSAALAWPCPASAQAPPKMLRLGFVGFQPRDAPIYRAFEKRMTELGYQEGRNFTFDYVQTPGIEAYERSYRELATRKMDIMMAVGNEPALRAARAAAGAIPIVFLAVDFDPLAKGFVRSLARPGGNITGIFVHTLELAAKRVELVREAMPNARRIGLLWDAASRDQAEAAAAAAGKLGFTPRLIEVADESPDYAAALRALDDAPGEPVVIPASPLFLRDRATIERLLLERRIPSISAFRELVEAGALMSYGIDLIGLFRDSATYVDQIAKGANPAELPIRQSSHFHLAVNLKSAATLGIALPVLFTARADEVIE